VAARHAQAQMKPRVSHLQTVLTTVSAGRHILNLICMSTLAIHAPHHKALPHFVALRLSEESCVTVISRAWRRQMKSSFSRAFLDLAFAGTTVAQLFRDVRQTSE